MTTKHDSTKDGVSQAWSWWLAEHDVSVPETIEEAVKAAVTDWLNRNGEELFADAIAKVLAKRPEVS
jgi:hypothetical protein